jgi:hypothetical protein
MLEPSTSVSWNIANASNWVEFAKDSIDRLKTIEPF